MKNEGRKVKYVDGIGFYVNGEIKVNGVKVEPQKEHTGYFVAISLGIYPPMVLVEKPCGGMVSVDASRVKFETPRHVIEMRAK